MIGGSVEMKFFDEICQFWQPTPPRVSGQERNMSKHEITVLRQEEFKVIGYWTPSHGLKEALAALEAGKKAVFLGACDCGCWDRNVQSKEAIEMIRAAGLEGRVFHNLVTLYSDIPVVIYPEELRPDEYHVADNLPWKI
jgi:hypothetical protein